MRDVLTPAAITALALAAVAAVVIGGQDSTVLASPPEAVAESFVRALVAHRDDLAMEYVDDASGVSLTTVRLRGEAMRRRFGAAVPNDVEGARSTIRGATATADVRVVQPAGTAWLSVSLVRTPGGVWRVANWTEG
jgi:hypothetical protein